MSPVSRGRKKKRSNKRGTKGGSGSLHTRPPHGAPATFESPLAVLHRALGHHERPQWFDPSITRVLENAGGLTAAPGPRELEQLTAELVGGELHRAVDTKQRGLWFDWWLAELVDATADRIEQQAGTGEWEAPLWLLHGLAALASPGLQSQIPLSAASTWVGSDAVGSLPDWLAQVPRIHATGEVFRMRDAYGTRFAVIVGLAYPGTADRPVYLFDIDASGFVTLVGAGVFDDVEQAGSAWSTMVGEAADEVRPERVTHSDELLCLVHVDLDQHGIRGDEPRTVTDNWFRANRRIHDLAAALDERGTAGLSMPRATSLYHDVDSSVMTEPFTAWYTHAFDTEPDPEAVETLAGEWMEGMIPETWFAVSPRRVVYQLQLIGDWIDGPLTDAVRELLPAWVRWLAERNGLPEHLAERAISVAELP